MWDSTTLEKLEAGSRAATQLDGLGMLVSLSEMRGMWMRDIGILGIFG